MKHEILYKLNKILWRLIFFILLPAALILQVSLWLTENDLITSVSIWFASGGLVTLLEIIGVALLCIILIPIVFAILILPIQLALGIFNSSFLASLFSPKK